MVNMANGIVRGRLRTTTTATMESHELAAKVSADQCHVTISRADVLGFPKWTADQMLVF